MKIILDFDKNEITIVRTVSVSDLVNHLEKLGLELAEWVIKVEERIEQPIIINNPPINYPVYPNTNYPFSPAPPYKPGDIYYTSTSGNDSRFIGTPVNEEQSGKCEFS